MQAAHCTLQLSVELMALALVFEGISLAEVTPVVIVDLLFVCCIKYRIKYLTGISAWQSSITIVCVYPQPKGR